MVTTATRPEVAEQTQLRLLCSLTQPNHTTVLQLYASTNSGDDLGMECQGGYPPIESETCCSLRELPLKGWGLVCINIVVRKECTVVVCAYNGSSVLRPVVT